jgi:DNA-directed RNA polymerase specialized sigma24 family protein
MRPAPVLPCDELRRLYEGERLTTLQIATRLGCSPTTAANRLRRCGVALRDARYQQRQIPIEELARLYVAEQWPIKAIAQHFGVSAGTIHNRLRAHQIPSRKRAALLLASH